MNTLDKSQKILIQEIERQACLNEIPKKAQSMRRKDVIDKLEGRLRMQFIKHCAKIILYPTNNLVEHWTNEMTSFIDWVQVNTLKPNNADIDRNLLKNTFFNVCDSMSTFTGLLNMIQREYGKPEIERNDEKLYKKYWQFQDAVLNELIRKNLTFNTMKSLVNQYLI